MNPYDLTPMQREELNKMDSILKRYPVTHARALAYADKCFKLYGDLKPEHLQIVLKELDAEMAGIKDEKK